MVSLVDQAGRVRAVVLVKGKKGAALAESIKKISGVREAYDVTGRFNAVALVEVDGLSELKRVVFEIHSVEGVKGTETLVVI